MPKKVSPPGLTRFTVNLIPRNGGNWIYLSCDTDEIVIPPIGASIGLDSDYGVTTEVTSVSIYPTCDPMVWVAGKSILVETASEANEIATAAIGFGWKRSG